MSATTQISKAGIDRLGNKIRSEISKINDTTLVELQDYRTSHKDVLSQVFNLLCDATKKIHSSCIVTYRIKRFESIISKLDRYPDMRFSRMWDIAGCRCILRNDKDVYKLKSLLEEETTLEIIKEYDYLVSPQKDGYRSLHLFLKFGDSDKVVEVQLRSQIDHNWATLVEITDLLFDTKIKEYGDNAELSRFHFLLSRINNLTIEEKYEISSTLKNYNYFEKLSEVFSRNYIKVRKRWFDIESSDHKFFLIETTKEDVPKIYSFKSSVEAENYYFNVYKTNQNANIVLTHLHKPNYNQISIAYSNYILTFHSFLTDCYLILESIIVETLQKGQYFGLFKIYNLYNSLLFHHISNLITEIQEIQNYSKDTSKRKRKSKNKRNEREWRSDILKQISSSNIRSKELKTKLNRNMPASRSGRFIVNQITKIVEKKYKRRLEKIIETSQVVKENSK